MTATSSANDDTVEMDSYGLSAFNDVRDYSNPQQELRALRRHLVNGVCGMVHSSTPHLRDEDSDD